MTSESFIHQVHPVLGTEEKRAVADYLEGDGWLTEFQQTRKFEEAVARACDRKHAAAVTSGTTALYCALKALGIGPGHEVIVPDFTMIASANAVLMAGATPVLVDIEESHLCLDLSLAEKAITQQTRAIIMVTLNGRAPDMYAAQDLARKNGLYLIEDSAQSLGSSWKGRPLGKFGDVACFSFSPHKIITTGQGGAVVADDDTVMDRVRKVKDFGRRRSGVDEHVALGFNFKFTDLQAVIGIEQMARLTERIGKKRELFGLYREELAEVSQVKFLETDLREVTPWFNDIQVPEPTALVEHLKERGIGSRVFYPPIHTQAPYSKHKWGEDSFKAAEDSSARGLWLPSALSLTREDVVRICSEIKNFYGKTS